MTLTVSGTCLARRLHEAANTLLYNVVDHVNQGINIMSIFGTILSKIFPSSHPANTAPADPAAAAAPAAADPTAAPDATAAPAAAAEPVDVEAVLSAMQANTSEQLNWRTSIVDLMKLLGLDSSLAARKELAGELHYSGDTNDSASMNIGLHKAVMEQLAANGGKVPDSLKG
jgi:PBP1b-binding outer membrane lipoprotein LpoB